MTPGRRGVSERVRGGFYWAVVVGVLAWLTPAVPRASTLLATLRALATPIVSDAMRASAIREALNGSMWAGFSTVGTWSLGRFAARRHRLAQNLAARADELELDRERARSALVDERSRIARELHDVIAHSVSLMGVQAGAVRVVLERDPDSARESLLSIEQTAREAVDELRRLLGVLRTTESAAARSPQPGLADVPALAEQVRGAGLEVDVAVEGQAEPLARGVDLAAYRIVQEALTNAVKHSAGRNARVMVRHAHDHVEIEVVDDGRGINGRGTPGHGLVGMRERAALYGGKLDAGPRHGGGYAVRARLPRHPVEP